MLKKYLPIKLIILIYFSINLKLILKILFIIKYLKKKL